MPHTSLINSTDLNLWANRKESQDKLPQLLRRLIRATTPNLKRLSFPSDESVQMGGWDGTVEVQNGNDFVPDGVSVWELGSNRDVKVKADGDYTKRTNNPRDVELTEATFVFVTPRRWGGKDAWIKEKQEEGKWREVRAYDADDLESFFEIAPSVHIWASILLGKRPEGSIDIANYWAEWTSVTRPKTKAALVIAGRQEALDKVSDWLQGQAACIGLQAETQSEAVAFLAACIELLPESIKEDVLAKSVVVEQEIEWRRLSLSLEPLILVPTFADRSLVASAVERGHHVLLPLGLSETPTIANIALRRPYRDAVYQALEDMNVPRHQLGELATLGRRSLSALRLRIAVNPSSLIPEWAQPSEARALLPALLIGRWHDSNEADREIISRLAGCEYSQVSNVLLRWANTSYPFIRRVGDVWLVISKADSWLLLSRFLDRSDIERFEEIALEVLGQSDPKYALSIEQRRAAAVLGIRLTHSGHLRSGLAETLALMAARSDIAPLADASAGQFWADRVIYNLFKNTNAWEQWATLSESLVSLAEASPNNFLAAVDSIISGEEPIATSLFQQEDSYWSGPVHTGLLYALESLAWSPNFLMRAATQLARLAEIDSALPKQQGRWMNRPNNSLREIFLSWHPCTMATLEQRLKVIDQIRRLAPDIAWSLMLDILHYPDSRAHPTHRPKWRDWGGDEGQKVTEAEVSLVTKAMVPRLIEDVGMEANKWSSLIALIDDLPNEYAKTLLDWMKEKFFNLGKDVENSQLQNSLRNSLRKIISRHSSYPDAQWSMPKERIDFLQTLCALLEPNDLILRHAWQFSASAQFVLEETEDWQRRQSEIDEIRRRSIVEIYEDGNLPAILQLAQQSEDPRLVGWTVGNFLPLAMQEDDFLQQTLGATEQSLIVLGQGYINGRLYKEADWLEPKINSPILKQNDDSFKGRFYLSLPSYKRTWDLVALENVNVQNAYWQNVGLWGHGALGEGDLSYFVDSLISYGRLTEAIYYISSHSHSKNSPFSAPFILRTLEMAVSAQGTQGVDWEKIISSVPRLLNVIESSQEIEDERLVPIELFFLPCLEHSEYKPKALIRGLCDSPSLFRDVIKMAFRSQEDKLRELSPEEQSQNLLAHTLLRMWDTLPGSDGGNNINTEHLSAWVKIAIQMVNECGRGTIGEQQIGQLLSNSPLGSDNVWPHEAVRRVIEEAASKKIEEGFEVGTLNSRGVTTRGLTDGGVQERELAEQYYSYAVKLRDDWQRTSHVLNRIGDYYQGHARGEDIEADLTQDLWQ